MFHLGQPIVYRVPKSRHVLTRKHGGVEVTGSVHHPEQVEFAGLVSRLWPDGSFDIAIFPPNRAPVTVSKVPSDELKDPSAFAFDAPAAA